MGTTRARAVITSLQHEVSKATEVRRARCRLPGVSFRPPQTNLRARGSGLVATRLALTATNHQSRTPGMMSAFAPLTRNLN
ncbi:unnamed protein product [Danaus chrysippus]|uniref:(African queen) hypothetical protein n=1 Tax=Danaus chrysippus TaxID=151541 RepID=A0A8J2R4U0_9NEOP|nr:unnamed protein product [Danaus chrysippus]